MLWSAKLIKKIAVELSQIVLGNSTTLVECKFQYKSLEEHSIVQGETKEFI